MVGLMADDSEERIKSLINCVTFAADNPSKLETLHQLKHQLLSHLQQDEEYTSFSPFLPSLLKLHFDAFSPVRKSVSEVIGEIGLRHLEFLPEIIPALLTVVDDDTPAVARQAITSGTSIFCCTLEKIAIQGLCASKLDDSLESAWEWMLKLKEKIYSIAFEPGCDGIRLLALKFVAAVILIYTPDPNGNAEPPPHLIGDGYANDKEVGFSVSWLRRGHPILKLGDLSIEASQSLGLLLDQLRLPIVKSLSTSMVVVLINCLSAIAVKRPSFYGRILPVLLGLDPSNSVIKGLHAYGVQNALKNAFFSCLKCAHPSATPWRDRLLVALRELGAGDLAEKALEGVCNINGNVKEEKAIPVVVKEEQSLEPLDSTHKVGRKRSSDLDVGNRNEDDDTPGKRAKSLHIMSEEQSDKSDALHTGVEVKSDSSGQTSMSKEDGLDAVQQLIGLFGALVAQGEKAAASLEILISGISPDLLADVVIANLRNLSSTRPMVEGDELQENMGLHRKRVDPDTPFGQISLFLTNALCGSGSGHIPSAVDPVSHNIKPPLLEESHAMGVVDNYDACVTSSKPNDLINTETPSTFTSGNLLESKGSVVDFEIQAVGPAETAIPGLDNAHTDVPLDTVASSSLASADLDDGSQDHVTSVGERSKEELLLSLSTERSGELSSKTATLDANIGMASTATSLAPVQQFVLPKISAPVIELCGEDKDALQKLVFSRIVEAYKQVAVSGGSQLRFSLLSYLGVELSLDLDLWTCLQTHILSDYINNEGHELTLRVLYRLYGEAEEERDFFSSRTATSVYETFLLKVAETLRDSFPASDKSLSRLFSEVPYLPESSLDLLECLCSPEMGDKDEKESHYGDRVTQGLSAVWSLIMLRPTLRDVLLKIALKSAVHRMEEVRMKAIRLVANKLYPLPSITLQIEEFAKEKLLCMVDTHSADTTDAEKSSIHFQKNSEIVLATKDQATGETMPMDSSSHTTQSGMTGTSVSEAQRCMSLYFALCTKKHGLLRQIFINFKSSPEAVKQAVHSHMPILIRTVGASPSLVEIISDPPAGSEKLLMQVLHTLTDGRVPSAELISTIKKLYETKMKDIEILFPILPFLPNEEVLRVFPQAVNLSQDKFQASLTRLLQGSSPSSPVLTPPEVLIAIHSIDPDKDGIPLKKVTDACNVCFEQRQIFTHDVIAKVLNQLVEQTPLPLLFMRTVLQAIGAFPALVDFIMEILSRLVSKQIWKYPKLWVGFLKCAQLTQPRSFSVLLKLPQAQLESALNKIPTLKAPLAAHANQPDILSGIPRSVHAVLGISSDPQAASQPQSGQQMKINESSGNTSDSQPESQSQSSQLMKIKESPGIASDAQAQDADKDFVNEKSKESSGGS